MSWGKLDDRYDDNRKVKRAWRAHPRAVGLHAMAITYCSRHETDGLVDPEWLAEKVPVERERARLLEVMVEVGMFIPADAGHYRVNDYLVYNPSRAQLDVKRKRDAERKAAKAATGSPAESEPIPRGSDAESDATPNGSAAASRAGAGAGAHRRSPSRPVPSQPDPCPPSPPRSGGRQRDRERWERDSQDWAEENVPEFPWQEVIALASSWRDNPSAPEPTVDALRRHLQRTRGVAA